jgi:hypothetical protein
VLGHIEVYRRVGKLLDRNLLKFVVVVEEQRRPKMLLQTRIFGGSSSALLRSFVIVQIGGGEEYFLIPVELVAYKKIHNSADTFANIAYSDYTSSDNSAHMQRHRFVIVEYNQKYTMAGIVSDNLMSVVV